MPGEPEPKHLKFEHMLKAGEEREDKEVKILKRITDFKRFSLFLIFQNLQALALAQKSKRILLITA